MPTRARWWVVTLALVLTGSACGGGSDKKDSKALGAESSTTVTTAESTTTTKPEPDETPKVVQLKETMTVDGFEVTVHEVKIPLSTEGKVFQPIPGTLLVGLDTEVKNPVAEPKKFRPSLELLDGANRAFPETATSITPEPPDGDIPASSSKRGLYTFQITEGSQAPGLRLVLFGAESKAPPFLMPVVAGGTPPAAPEVAASTDPAKVLNKGEAVRAGWAVMVVHTVQNPFPPPDKYTTPDAGNRFVVLDVDVFNTSKQTRNSYDLEAKIQDAANQTFRTSSKRAVSFPARALDDLPAGTGRRGPIVFEIPEASGGGGLKLLLSVDDQPPVVITLS